MKPMFLKEYFEAIKPAKSLKESSDSYEETDVDHVNLANGDADLDKKMCDEALKASSLVRTAIEKTIDVTTLPMTSVLKAVYNAYDNTVVDFGPQFDILANCITELEKYEKDLMYKLCDDPNQGITRPQ